MRYLIPCFALVAASVLSLSAIAQPPEKGGKKGGDNFYTMQLQQERDAAQQKLEEARAELSKAQTDLDTLKEDARRAGVAPGLFR